MMPGRVSAVWLLLLVLLSACDKKGSTSPTPTTQLPAAPSGVRVDRLSVGDRWAQAAWNAVSGADRYIVEVGRSPGASDVVVETVTTTSRQLSSLPTGELFLRVKATNSVGTGPASLDFRLTVPDLKDVIEALFLGTGRYSYDPNTAVVNRFTGWQPGTTIRVRGSSSLNAEQAQALQTGVSQIQAATDGVLSATVEMTAADVEQSFACFRWGGGLHGPDCPQRWGEIGVFVTNDGVGWCGIGTGTNWGCAPRSHDSSLTIVVGGAAVLGPTAIGPTVAHEIGHMLGLQHMRWTTDHRALPGLAAPTMGFPNESVPRFSDAEVQAIQTVYRAGLRPGATRADFLARGLIN